MQRDPFHPWRNRAASRLRRALAYVLVLALTVLGHLTFVVFLLLLSHLNLGPQPEHKVPARPVTLRPLSSEQWARNRGQSLKQSLAQRSQAQSQSRPAPPPEEKKKEIAPKGQVVDVAPGNDQQDPNAKYLAEHSNKVQKESRAREQTAFYRNAMPQRTTTVPRQGAGTDQADKMQIAGNNGLGKDDRPLREAGKHQQQAFEVPDIKHRQEIALRPEPGTGPGPQVRNHPENPEVMGNSNRLKIQRGEGSQGGDEDASAGRKGTPGVANLMPSSAVLDKLSGAAANDHLSDVEEGDGTYLNTKEWKYAGFFNRVKQSVGMHWDPGGQLRQRDPTGNIYGGRDRYTILNVILNERGMVKEVYVEKSCGLDFLDLEAIQSFERAQPFPNPPPGLIGSDSTVRFQFGFFLDMGSGPRLRLFRQGG